MKSLSTTVTAPGDRTVRAAITLALVLASDALFYEHPVGISLSVFLVMLAAAAILANRLKATRREWMSAGAILILALLPAVETIGLLSVSFAFAGVAAFALVVTGNARAAWRERLRRMAILLTADIGGWGRRFSRWRRSIPPSVLTRFTASATGWLVPLALGLVFVALFSMANPVFWSWVSLFDLWSLLIALEPLRLIFWALVGVFVLTFVRVPGFARPRRKGGDVHVSSQGWRMETSLIVRSLVIFNAIFALQTVLDAIYLWGGAELPEGVSPAANAQKAAYLLVVSALLAAGFVLVAIRDNGGEQSRSLIRGLIYLWIVQNIVLVLSAILRLDLYVELYSLTRLRLAAFIWMGLVIVGLVLIVLRTAMCRSNAWLIKANLLSLGIVLYGCSIVDLNAAIASYNVEHSREMSGRGVELDRRYLCRLGPSALPAIDAFVDMQVAKPQGSKIEALLDDCAANFRLTLLPGSPDWRGWTFREHRLRLYLAQRPEPLGSLGDAVERTYRR